MYSGRTAYHDCHAYQPYAMHTMGHHEYHEYHDWQLWHSWHSCHARRKRKSRKFFAGAVHQAVYGRIGILVSSDNLPNIARSRPAAFAEAGPVGLARANPPDGGFYRHLPIARCVSLCRKIRPPKPPPLLQGTEWVRLRSRQTSKSKMRWQRSKDGPAVPIHASITTISSSTRHRTNDFWTCWNSRDVRTTNPEFIPLPAFR